MNEGADSQMSFLGCFRALMASLWAYYVFFLAAMLLSAAVLLFSEAMASAHQPVLVLKQGLAMNIVEYLRAINFTLLAVCGPDNFRPVTIIGKVLVVADGCLGMVVFGFVTATIWTAIRAAKAGGRP